MDSSLILSNVLNPAVLFFSMGLTAVFLKSGLVIPQLIPKLFSQYLLFAIGLKGGHELHKSGLSCNIVMTLIVAVVVTAVVPVYSLLRLLWAWGQEDAPLFAVLCASASCTATPAAMRLTVPAANLVSTVQ